MQFLTNRLGNNVNGMTTNGNNSGINEEIEMKNVNTNIQMNIGNYGSQLTRSTTKLLAGFVVAGLVAMAATFGSVSADSPTNTGSNAYFNLGPDIIEPSSANAYFNLGPDIIEPNIAAARLP